MALPMTFSGHLVHRTAVRRSFLFSALTVGPCFVDAHREGRLVTANQAIKIVVARWKRG
jgi:hypothetical protein